MLVRNKYSIWHLFGFIFSLFLQFFGKGAHAVVRIEKAQRGCYTYYYTRQEVLSLPKVTFAVLPSLPSIMESQLLRGLVYSSGCDDHVMADPPPQIRQESGSVVSQKNTFLQAERERQEEIARQAEIARQLEVRKRINKGYENLLTNEIEASKISARLESETQAQLAGIQERQNSEFAEVKAQSKASFNKSKNLLDALLCFPGETPVSVKDDSAKGYHSEPISNIRIGDSVVTCNLSIAGGTCEFGRVQKVFESSADHLIKLTFGEFTLRATDNHPFFVVEKQDWVKAQDLEIGNHLFTISGEPIVLEEIETEEGDFKVYNLDVQGHHNYYACDVLVHNCNAAAVGAVGAPDLQVENSEDAPTIHSDQIQSDEAKPHQCFVGGTQVLAVDEQGHSVLRPIEEIQVGDKVRTCNTQLNHCTTRKVVALHTNTSDVLVHLTLSGAGIPKTEKLQVTPDHPFYLSDTVSPVPASELKVGSLLWAYTGQETAEVTEAVTVKYQTSVTVYSFTVDTNEEGNNNYFVSERLVLVHNCGLVRDAVQKAIPVVTKTAIGAATLAVCSGSAAVACPAAVIGAGYLVETVADTVAEGICPQEFANGEAQPVPLPFEGETVGKFFSKFGPATSIWSIVGKHKKESTGEAVKPQGDQKIIQVTPQGVALPPGRGIPADLVENPKRPGSYGVMENQKFKEKLRIDPATERGKPGPEKSHYHLNGGKEHFAPGGKDPGFAGNN